MNRVFGALTPEPERFARFFADYTVLLLPRRSFL